jgi:hypothetical protein
MPPGCDSDTLLSWPSTDQSISIPGEGLCGDGKSWYPVLKKLAFEKGFFDYADITDSSADAIDFIVNHPPVKA